MNNYPIVVFFFLVVVGGNDPSNRLLVEFEYTRMQISFSGPKYVSINDTSLENPHEHHFINLIEISLFYFTVLTQPPFHIII